MQSLAKLGWKHLGSEARQTRIRVGSEKTVIGLWSTGGDEARVTKMLSRSSSGTANRTAEMRQVKSSSTKKFQPVQSVRLRPKPKSAADKRKLAAANRPTILVVDDDPSILRALRRLVLAYGFQVETFAKPSELLGTQTPSSNACMVVDIDLPEMTGIEMCDKLKRTGCNLPTILITGRTDLRTREAAAQADAIAVLYKPFDEGPFLEAIGRAIAISSSR